ncbi:MAG TPA: hypothetical protein VEU55_06640 [Gemmatimonadales bacterium]|nr:hypothetical protein [Gemmatimonadales bacterium]
MTAPPAPPAALASSGATPLPSLGLPLRARGLGPGAALSVLVHAALVTLVLLRGRALLERDDHERGARRGEGGERPAFNLFLFPRAAAPAEVAVPPPPGVAPAELPAPRPLPLELPRVEFAPLPLPRPRPAPLGTRDAAVGAGPGGAPSPGTRGGAGADTGPGTGGEGGYIFGAAPRTAILPPLARVPGAVAGRTYRVRFWVAADGRVTQVAVEPPIADAGYSREFQQRMMAYQFYPAHTRDGRNVASVVTVTIRPGN